MTEQESTSAGGGVQGARSNVQRVFRLLFDVRSFKANRKFPFNRSKVVVVVSFPNALEDAINSDPTKNLRIGQLRSRPAVETARGSEVLIPNSFLEINFTTTAIRFASTLADDPHCKVQVFREDRYRSDMLLGEALVPLQPLLTQPWIDGYAPVMELDKSKTNQTGVQLGSVRVVVAVEEVGVISADEQAPSLQMEESSQLQVKESSVNPSGRFERFERSEETSDSDEEQEFTDTARHKTQSRVGASYLKQAEDVVQAASEKVRVPQFGVNQSSLSALPPPPQPNPPQITKPSTSVEQITNTQEYASAWEFEVWRSAEEARWRAEMKEKEIARLAYIQKEWKKREKERLEEINKSHREVELLQKNLKKSLISVEEREKKLIMAEEALSRRRKEIEREAATRALESQAAIKRTKDEFQCRLDIEKSKVTQASDLQQSTESRMHRIQESFDKLEREYQEYREKIRSTSESELQMQILGLQSDLQKVKEDKLKLQHARIKQKDVITKLERQLHWAQSIIHQEHNITSSGSNYGAQAQQLNTMAQTGLKNLQDDQAELSKLREQILQLKKLRESNQSDKESSDRETDPENAEASSGSAGETTAIEEEGTAKTAVSQADDKNKIIAERGRLEEEMKTLLSSGMYSSTDAVVITFQERIKSLQ